MLTIYTNLFGGCFYGDAVEIAYGTSVNFNETVISEAHIPKILVAYKNHRRFQGLHFLFYQAPCHVTQRSNVNFASANIDVKSNQPTNLDRSSCRIKESGTTG